MKHILPKPLVRETVCGGVATIFAWGVHRTPPNNKLFNWSLRRHQEGDYELARMLLLEYATNCTIWAPPPIDHNGLVICPKETWFDEIDTSTERSVPRRGDITTEALEIEGVIIRRGPHADGVILHSKTDVFLFTPADCATLVLSYDDDQNQKKVIVGHASRNSLINMSRFTGKEPIRQHEGLVESAIKHIPSTSLQGVQAWIGLSIGPGPHFAHESNDKNNPWNGLFLNYIREKYGSECFAPDEKEGELGWLDIKALARSQLIASGIPKENIAVDGICTYGDKDASGNHLWYSNVRNNEHGRATDRNFVFVVRNY